MKPWLDKGFLILAIGCVLGLGAIISYEYKEWKWSSINRCEAAQATILEEMDFIIAAGKFPSEKVTDRWKMLLGWC